MFLSALAAGFAGGAVRGRACNVPVFRYALERWAPEAYEVVVFHRGSLGWKDNGLVEQLEQGRRDTFANFELRTVSVSSGMDDPMQVLWQAQTNSQPPWIVVRAPGATDGGQVWTGPLTESTTAALVDSPARRRISELLLKGVSAVWVLLECGEMARDEAAVDLLSSELRKLQKTIALPAPAPGDPEMRAGLPLHVDFSLVRVTRHDPAESFFIEMLQHGKSFTPTRPIAFPIFGRGRVLAALTGRELNADTIAEACRYITGSCSCEVKELNPGKDLLLAANWNSIFDKPLVREATSPPPAPPPAAPAPTLTPTPTPTPTLTPSPSPTPPPLATTIPPAPAVVTERTRWLVPGIIGAALLVLATGFIALRSKRPPVQ